MLEIRTQAISCEKHLIMLWLPGTAWSYLRFLLIRKASSKAHEPQWPTKSSYQFYHWSRCIRWWEYPAVWEGIHGPICSQIDEAWFYLVSKSKAFGLERKIFKASEGQSAPLLYSRGALRCFGVQHTWTSLPSTKRTIISCGNRLRNTLGSQ